MATVTSPGIDNAVVPARPEPAGPRYDIQGLRAFAVLAVILDHLTGWPGGGFVGVDIFFVISGYLITGLLLQEHEKTGHISFTGFYRRRFKRIIPAAVLVTIATVVAAYLTFSQVRFQQIKGDALAALFFVANWRYESQEINYFNADRAVSPLQHYWSLSIEEQFYFIWPWLMLGIFAFLLRRNASRRRAHAVIGAVMATVVITSFVWALEQTASDGHSAYFSSLTRVWELGVGAFLAVVSTQLARIPNALRPLLAWVGLGGMIASVWVISGDQSFPAPAAALPVLSAALVIAAGTSPEIRQQRFLWPLTNAGSRYVGDASYSLYLWHFPIIVVGTTLIGGSNGDKLILAFAITAISVFSYELYENPLRRATWFGRKGGFRDAIGDTYKYKVTSALLLATAIMAGLSLRPIHAPESALSKAVGQFDNTIGEGSGAPAEQPAPKLVELSSQIEKALSDTSWPNDLTQPVDVAATEQRVEPVDIGLCSQLPNGPTGPEDCAWGPAGASHSAVLVGDSVGMAYADMLRSATVGHGWQFLSRVATACPFIDMPVNVGDPTFNRNCPAIKSAAVRDIRATKPNVLFVVNYGGDRYWGDWFDAAQRQLAKVADSVGQIVFVAAVPPAPEPIECFTPTSSPADCTGKPDENWARMRSIEQQLASANNGLWIDSENWFCYRGLCPPYVGKTPVRPDSIHMLLPYSTVIEPVVDEALVQAGVFESQGANTSTPRSGRADAAPSKGER